jgi:hypothetical protein
MLQDRNQQLTACQGIRERKGVISGQNVAGQESTTYRLSRHQRKKRGDQWTECHRTTTYILSRHQRKKRGDQWTECHRTGINNLHSVKASEKEGVISGQNVQESITYSLLRYQRKERGDQWTECHRTGIKNLLPVKASEKEKGSSVDIMSQDRNQQLTYCQGIRERKGVISGQNVAGQESTTYKLSRHQRKKRGDQWTECCRTGINNLQTVKSSEKEKG